MPHRSLIQETDAKTTALAAKAVTKSIALIDNWEKGTRTRFSQIREYEENYLGKVRPRTSGRSNFPVPVLAKFLDEMHSHLDESPTLKVDSSVSISRKLIGLKATAILKDFKKPSKGNWNRYDRISKRHAEFAGYNFVDFYSEEENGTFKLVFEPLHHTEAIFEIGGGNDIEKHMGVGKFPIWRTKGQLESRAKSGIYSEEQVKKLSVASSSADYKKHIEFFQTKTEHLKVLGIDVEQHSYAGEAVFPLAQMQITMDDGERYLVTFDYWSGIWVRFIKLKTVFPSGMYSMDLWQTSEDVEVTCKGPCDDIFPFAEGIRVKVNQLFDNHTKKIYGQRGYDPSFVPDPTQLIWKKADQLTKMKAYGGKPLASGVYEFKTDDMTNSTLEFIKWMDEFLVSVVGINPNDVSSEVQKVGIMFGQLQKTSARLGAKNKSYNEMWQRLGYRALHEMKEFLSEPQAIQIIGSKGVEWESFVGSELENPADFDILAEGSNIELEMNEGRKKAQGEAIETIIGDPDLKKQANPRALAEFILKNKGQFSEEEVARLMDVANYGNEEMIGRADLACEEIIEKKYSLEDLPRSASGMPIWSDQLLPKIYKGADVAFMQYILDFANKLGEDEHEDKIALLAYGRAHKSIVVRNMAQKGVGEMAQKGIPPDKLNVPLPSGMGPQGPGGGVPPGVGANPVPSPALAQKVATRGMKPLGHMPVRHAPSMQKRLAPRRPTAPAAR